MFHESTEEYKKWGRDKSVSYFCPNIFFWNFRKNWLLDAVYSRVCSKTDFL